MCATSISNFFQCLYTRWAEICTWKCRKSLSQMYKVPAIESSLYCSELVFWNVNTSSSMGNRAPVLGGEKREQLQRVVMPSSGWYPHVAVAMDRWNKLGFGETHPFLLTRRACIADLQRLALRWLQLGVRRPVLNSSLQQWTPEVPELYLTMSLIILFSSISCGYCGCNCVLFWDNFKYHSSCPA